VEATIPCNSDGEADAAQKPWSRRACPVRPAADRRDAPVRPQPSHARARGGCSGAPTPRPARLDPDSAS